MNALEKLARNWAGFVRRDSRPIKWCIVMVVNGLAFFVIDVFVFQGTILLVLGIVMLVTAFMLFERSGFIQLLEDKHGRRS